MLQNMPRESPCCIRSHTLHRVLGHLGDSCISVHVTVSVIINHVIYGDIITKNLCNIVTLETQKI